MSHSHEELQGLAPAYALGTLDGAERHLFEAHLKRCPECAAEMRSLQAAVHALARAVPQMTPPAELRGRVMSAVERAPAGLPASRPAASPSSDRRMWLPVAASVTIALGAGIYGSHIHVESRLMALSERAEAADREIAEARREAVNARSAMEILAAPDVVRIDLRGQESAAGATARMLWSRQRGLVFAGTNLPQPAPGRRYQVWLRTSSAPVSAGILPDPAGEFAVLPTPPDAPQVLGVAVTLEPDGGATAPTGPVVLVGERPTSF